MAETQIKISLIIATWNSGSTIDDTLSSILEQKYGNTEVIVIDGKSTVSFCSDIKCMTNSPARRQRRIHTV